MLLSMVSFVLPQKYIIIITIYLWDIISMSILFKYNSSRGHLFVLSCARVQGGALMSGVR